MFGRLSILAILLASVSNLEVRGDSLDQTAGTRQCRPDDLREDDDAILLQTVGDRSRQAGKAKAQLEGDGSTGKSSTLHTARAGHGEAVDASVRLKHPNNTDDRQTHTDADVSLAQPSLPSQSPSFSPARNKSIQEAEDAETSTLRRKTFKGPPRSFQSRLWEVAANLESSLLLRASTAKRVGEKYLAETKDSGVVLPFLAALVLVVICVAACVYTCSTPLFLEPGGSADIKRSAQDIPRLPPVLSSRPRLSSAASRLSSAACLVPPRSLGGGNGEKDPYDPNLTLQTLPPKSLRDSLMPRESFGPGPDLLLAASAQPAEGPGKDAADGGLSISHEPPLPLYPPLVLPAREAHLQISMPSLSNVQATGAGRFFVLGPLGNKIMYANLCGSAVEIRMAPPSSELVASVSRADTSPAEKPRLEICRPDGTTYGWVIERLPSGGSRDVGQTSYTVVVSSRSGQGAHDLLLVRGNPAECRFTATAAADGQPVASATPEKRRGAAGSFMEIRTQRRADTALVLASFLGIVLLRG